MAVENEKFAPGGMNLLHGYNRSTDPEHLMRICLGVSSPGHAWDARGMELLCQSASLVLFLLGLIYRGSTGELRDILRRIYTSEKGWSILEYMYFLATMFRNITN